MEGELLYEIEKWSQKYDFNFQFWGYGNNNVYIEKDGVELYNVGDCLTPIAAVQAALSFIYKINRTPHTKRVF